MGPAISEEANIAAPGIKASSVSGALRQSRFTNGIVFNVSPEFRCSQDCAEGRSTMFDCTP